MSYKKSSKKTLEAMKILGFPVSKNFNDLDIKGNIIHYVFNIYRNL